MSFRTGDKVRCIDDKHFYGNRVVEGGIYEVAKVAERSSGWVYLKDVPSFWSADCFELVNDAEERVKYLEDLLSGWATQLDHTTSLGYAVYEAAFNALKSEARRINEARKPKDPRIEVLAEQLALNQNDVGANHLYVEEAKYILRKLDEVSK